MKRTFLLSIVLVFLVFAGKAFFSEAPLPEASLSDVPVTHAFLTAEPEFIGVDRCKTCHRKEEDGEQFGIWEKSAHAKAYATLATDEAKAIAAKKGISNPQESGECLKCHVTAYGVPAERLGAKYTIEAGVGCESCHGAGGDYYKKSTMEAISAGEIDGATVGLVVPTKETCTTCHNEKSPTFKPFNYEERLAKIAHPIPSSE